VSATVPRLLTVIITTHTLSQQPAVHVQVKALLGASASLFVVFGVVVVVLVSRAAGAMFLMTLIGMGGKEA
jgi:hypothetical protein